jgi:hypothetical protein
MQVRIMNAEGNVSDVSFRDVGAFEAWFMRAPVVDVQDGVIELCPVVWTQEYKRRWLQTNGTPQPFDGGCCG